MPLHEILEVKLFYVWGIDFMEAFVPSNNNLYILVAINYVSKWLKHKHSQPMMPWWSPNFLRKHLHKI